MFTYRNRDENIRNVKINQNKFKASKSLVAFGKLG